MEHDAAGVGSVSGRGYLQYIVSAVVCEIYRCFNDLLAVPGLYDMAWLRLDSQQSNPKPKPKPKSNPNANANEPGPKT